MFAMRLPPSEPRTSALASLISAHSARMLAAAMFSMQLALSQMSIQNSLHRHLLSIQTRRSRLPCSQRGCLLQRPQLATPSPDLLPLNTNAAVFSSPNTCIDFIVDRMRLTIIISLPNTACFPFSKPLPANHHLHHQLPCHFLLLLQLTHFAAMIGIPSLASVSWPSARV